jgi:hypothetical protein
MGTFLVRVISGINRDGVRIYIFEFTNNITGMRMRYIAVPGPSVPSDIMSVDQSSGPSPFVARSISLNDFGGPAVVAVQGAGLMDIRTRAGAVTVPFPAGSLDLSVFPRRFKLVRIGGIPIPVPAPLPGSGAAVANARR